jgi:hypothetical protein
VLKPTSLLQHEMRVDVAYGSFSTNSGRSRDVRYPSNSDQISDITSRRLCAINDQTALQKMVAYSITSSARPSSGSGKAMPSALAVLRLMINSTFAAW